MGEVKKVAILGGGVGAMTAAWYLTEANKHAGPDGTTYDITVHQLGWRLGGKGASGRNMNPGYGKRIEEHGLHIWMGFYANAFKIMKAAYHDMHRPEGHPLREWSDAFKPQDVVTGEASTLLAWYPWIMNFPTNGATPGEKPEFRSIHGALKLLCEKVRSVIDQIKREIANIVEHPLETAVDVVALLAIVERLESKLEQLRQTAQSKEPDDSHRDVKNHAEDAHDLLAELLASTKPIDSVLHYLYPIDIGVAMIRGIVRDRLWEEGRGWEFIDDIEWRTWLTDNGMHEESAWCTYIRLVYDLVFGYRDGIPDQEHADLCAGFTTKGVIRMCFEYDGSIYWKMQAGMGDTVFWPFYQVLKNRGVKFEFFHRVREVVPSEDDHSIASVRIGVQATLEPGRDEYDPKVMVNGLECWPSVPNYDQLEQGELLRRGNVDLEDYNAPWPDLQEIELQVGRDFDWVVFGLSLGAVPYVCPKMLDPNRPHTKPWRDMVDNVRTVRTQACQLWLNRDIQGLGWPPALNGDDLGQRAVMGAFVEPMDTWADMSQLIPRETWPDGEVRNIAYFCGPATAETDVYQTSLDLVRFDLHWIWTKAYDEVGRFKWEYLVDPDDREGQKRFASQYFRINVQPTELYVLSVHGSTKYRLPADTGYKNLCVVGDWNRNPLPLGCVEGAVMGGMMGIEPIVGKLHIVD